MAERTIIPDDGGIVPNDIRSPYRCVLCTNPVHVDSRGRALSHRVRFRGLWGRITYDGSCAGRGHRAVVELTQEDTER